MTLSQTWLLKKAAAPKKEMLPKSKCQVLRKCEEVASPPKIKLT